MERAKIKKTISVQATLLAIPVGEKRVIKNRVIKSNVIQASITKLREKGYSFECTERGRIDDAVVTRLK